MNKPVIVGWGHTPFGRRQEGLAELIQSAAAEAIAHAQIEASAIDGIWLGHFGGGLVPDGFTSSLVLGTSPELRFKPATRCENACASGSAAIYAAIDAIRAGRVRIALVVGAEKMSHLDTAGVTRALGSASCQVEEADITFPGIFAEIAKAYRARYGDPTEAMAHIAVKNHENAMRNPHAHMRKLLALDFCMEVSERNPIVAEPLKVSDCSLITDGAAALIITREDMLSDFSRGVAFKAAQQVNDYLPMSRRDALAFEGPQRALAEALRSAGLTVDDLDFAEVHDCFTIAELMIVEAIGLAEPGRGRFACIDGVTRRDGRLPFNLSGGLKAKGHPVGATGVSMHVMAARQLTGSAEEMQLDAPSLGLCFNMGGSAVANYATVLEPVK